MSVPGNKNAAKAKLFEEALKRALARKEGSVDKGLDKLCDVIVRKAIDEEDQTVAQMIADRIDGKAKQQIEATGADGVDLFPTALNINFVRPQPKE